MLKTTGLYLGKPSYLLLFVTNKCNCNCGHCFYWRDVNREVKELTTTEYEIIAETTGSLLQLTITGGSPDMREDVPEIIDIFYNHCYPANITYCTNGYNTDNIAAHVERILTANRNLNLTVDISLDATGNKLDEIRGKQGLFDNVMKSYAMLFDLRKSFGSRLRIGCGICVSGLNLDSAEETAEWVFKNLAVDNITPILVRGETREDKAGKGDPDLFLKIAERIGERLRRGDLKGYSFMSSLMNSKDILQKRMIADIYSGKKTGLRCMAGRTICVIYPDGTIPGCEMRPEILGSLRESEFDLSKIWFSGKAEEFREKISQDKCECHHQCFLSSAMAASPKTVSRIVWNSIAGTLTKNWKDE